MSRLVSVVLIGLLLCTGDAWAFTPPANSPLARREHPRLWLSASTLPALRIKLAGPFKAEFQSFVSYLDGAMADGNGTHILNYAFVYQVGPVPGISYGHSMTQYRDRAKVLLNARVAQETSVWIIAFGYDWLFYDLTPAERTAAVANMKNTARQDKGDANTTAGNPTYERENHFVSHLAFWGDGIDDAAANTALDKWQSYVAERQLSLQNLIGQDGAWGQGLTYSFHAPYGPIVAIYRLLEAWRTANGYSREAVFGGGSMPLLRGYSHWILSQILPYAVPDREAQPDGLRRLFWRGNRADPGDTVWGMGGLDAIMAVTRMYKDIDPPVAALAQWMSENRVGVVGTSGLDGREKAVLAHFIFGEKVVAKSPWELGLPLTKKFDGQGFVAMRSKWVSDADPKGLKATLVTFLALPWARTAGSYMEQWSGAFTIDRQGPLAINSGNASHHGYSNETYAFNTMIFPDPTAADRPADPSDYDQGGQRYLSNGQLYSGAQLTKGSSWDLGGITRFEAANPAAGRDYDYMYADITRAYNGPAVKDRYNTAKVKLFTRQLVYLRPEVEGGPDIVVVYDRTETTDTRYEKRWLLHTSGDPQVDGTPTLERHGKWVYSGASRVTQTNNTHGSNGKLFSQTLLPAQRKIVKIGGPNPAGQWRKADSHEFEGPFGGNDVKGVKALDNSKIQYQGTHRIEVIPTVKSPYDTFLHVLEATDAGVANPTPTALLTGTALVGARIGSKRIVVFNQKEQLIIVGDLTIDVGGTFEFLICDLTPGGEYQLGGTTQIASAAGTISTTMSMAAGSKLTLKATGVVVPVAPSAPKRVRVVP